MEPIVVRPVVMDIVYDGFFSALRFNLLAAPIPVYEKMLEHLSADGATLESLRLDTTSLSTASITCALPSRNANVHLHIDRFGVTLQRVSDAYTAADVLHRAWTAVQTLDQSLTLREHVLSVVAYGSIQDSNYALLIQRYLNPAFASTLTSTTFEFSREAGSPLKSGTLALEAVAGLDQFVAVKTSMTLDAARVRVLDLRATVEALLVRELRALDIVVPRQDDKKT